MYADLCRTSQESFLFLRYILMDYKHMLKGTFLMELRDKCKILLLEKKIVGVSPALLVSYIIRVFLEVPQYTFHLDLQYMVCKLLGEAVYFLKLVDNSLKLVVRSYHRSAKSQEIIPHNLQQK